MKKAIIALAAIISIIIIGLLVLLGLSIAGILPAWSWGGNSTPPLANRVVLSAADVQALQLQYSSDRITILPSEDDTFVLEEYMTEDADKYKAKVVQTSGAISITTGYRPNWNLVFGFSAKIKLYIPAGFTGDISIKNSSGTIDITDNFSFQNIHASTSSGSIHALSLISSQDIFLSSSSGSINTGNLTSKGAVTIGQTSGSVHAEQLIAQNIAVKTSSGSINLTSATGTQILAETSSGSIRLNELNGDFTLSTTSGSIHVNGGTGSGHAQSSSGSVSVALSEAEGDISLASTSGRVQLTLPQSSEFNFTAFTNSGSVRLPSGATITKNSKDKDISGSFGSRPGFMVNLRASSGSITLQWG